MVHYSGTPNGCADLENDTEKRSAKKRQLIHLSEIDSWRRKRKGESPEAEAEDCWIKHKSLILAQDERWRRA